MRIVVILAPAAPGSPLKKYAEAMVEGMSSMGHHVDLFDATKDDGHRLAAYDYIALLSESASAIKSALPSCATKALASASSLIGKKGAAFVRKSGFFSGRALKNLMQLMEAQGMRVNWSELVVSAQDAGRLSKGIGA
ncbi:MAG TPA: hypothetical protein DCG47_05480 [Spirochaetaceae bacterium]|jgi:hypothetical protein|nr:hypothetical protein [Spirochaetaceae bacterium]